MRFAQRDFLFFSSAFKVILKRSPLLPVLSSSPSINIFAFHMFRDLDKRRHRRFISSHSFIYFSYSFSFKLISYTTNIHLKFHLQIQEGFSCPNAYSVYRRGLGWILLSVLCFPSLHSPPRAYPPRSLWCFCPWRC